MSFEVKSPKKLIEVALPLDIINEACAHEKMPGIGAHPRGIHLWWARRPLAAARAVIFGQLVNDPSWKWEMENPGQVPPNHLKASWAASRKRLFKIIEDIVKWENTTNEEVMEKAREEIRKSWREVCELNKDHPQAEELFNPDKLPALHDPFAGGGAIPLEAQRLGLEAYASDLNPVAVLINKAMIEIPPKCAGRAPIGPLPEDLIDQTNNGIDQNWPGVTGLAEDIRRYGTWVYEEAKKRIGHLYPSVEITKEMALHRPDLEPLIGQKLTVIAWIWARTVKSPNPAFSHVDVPLASSFILSSKEGKETYVKPVISGDCYHFTINIGNVPEDAKNGTKSCGGKKGFWCLMSNTPIDFKYIRDEAKNGRLGQKLMAIVVEGKNSRIYLEPISDHEKIANEIKPNSYSELFLPKKALGFRIQEYGMVKWDDLFTKRQLVALREFCNLINDLNDKILRDIKRENNNSYENDLTPIEQTGEMMFSYANTICLYLAFAIDRCTDFNNAVTRWVPGNQKVMNLFGRHAIPMTWDFPEANITANTVGGFYPAVNYIADCVTKVIGKGCGKAIQSDAQNQKISQNKFVSTDPPYYDNIGYSDLSDFFYIWLRRTLKSIIPDSFSTIVVPKDEELVANPFRFGNAIKAEEFFLEGMSKVFKNIRYQTHPEGPITIYYAFKQKELDEQNDATSTGWTTFLSAIINAGFSIVGTWPLRSEQEYRIVSMGTNALASSIVLVCRKRSPNAPTISRRDFIRELNKVLPEALDEMTKGSGDDRSPVAPVDLSQAIIGPGMAVFSKYSAVLEADGTPMTVKTALQLINRFLAEDDFDPDTQFCLHWFDQYGWGEGVYGQADVLARAKATSVDGLVDAGIVKSGNGFVRLKKWIEYPSDWDPTKDNRMPVWETLHHLIRALRQDGESSAGMLLDKVREKSEGARQLAYRLYTLCERQGWAEDARAYNELITSWSGIESAISAESVMQNQTKLEI